MDGRLGKYGTRVVDIMVLGTRRKNYEIVATKDGSTEIAIPIVGSPLHISLNILDLLFYTIYLFSSQFRLYSQHNNILKQYQSYYPPLRSSSTYHIIYSFHILRSHSYSYSYPFSAKDNIMLPWHAIP